MNFKGYIIHETFQSPLYDTFYTNIDDEVWGTVWGRVEDQVWVGCGGSNVDNAIFYKLVEYRFDKTKN